MDPVCQLTSQPMAFTDPGSQPKPWGSKTKDRPAPSSTQTGSPDPPRPRAPPPAGAQTTEWQWGRYLRDTRR